MLRVLLLVLACAWPPAASAASQATCRSEARRSSDVSTAAPVLLQLQGSLTRVTPDTFVAAVSEAPKSNLAAAEVVVPEVAAVSEAPGSNLLAAEVVVPEGGRGGGAQGGSIAVSTARTGFASAVHAPTWGSLVENDAGVVAKAELPEAAADGGDAEAPAIVALNTSAGSLLGEAAAELDHSFDNPDGGVFDVRLNSQLQSSAAEVVVNSSSAAPTPDDEPVQNGDDVNQSALDDADFAEDSTDGIPGEGVEHVEGSTLDPAGVGRAEIDRARYDEDWVSEWREGNGSHAHRRSATQSEAFKNSVLGRRPQLAATSVVVAAFFIARALH